MRNGRILKKIFRKVKCPFKYAPSRGAWIKSKWDGRNPCPCLTGSINLHIIFLLIATGSSGNNATNQDRLPTVKTLLIADDDRTTLETISRRLQSHENITVLTAGDGKMAIDLLNEKEVDLIITDLQMPVRDGFALLAHAREHYPGIPTFVITAHDTAENRSRLKEMDISHIFTKPLDMEALTKKMVEQLDAGADGQIHCMSLPTFLQLIEMESKTCTLTITPHEGANPGKLYFVRGELFAAEAGDLNDEAAAIEIIGWKKASIFISNSCKKRSKQISKSLMNILMQADAPPKEKIPAAPPQPYISRIMEALDNTPGILKYGLYEATEAGDTPIFTKNSPSEPFGAIRPSKILAAIEGDRNTAESSAYLLLHTNDQNQLVLFRFKSVCILVALKFGHPPYEFIKRTNSLLAVEKP